MNLNDFKNWALQQGMISTKEYVDRRFEDQEKAVQAALASAEKAVDKAENNAREWQKGSNEWRAAMSDRERDFLGRKEFYAIIATAAAVITLFMTTGFLR